MNFINYTLFVQIENEFKKLSNLKEIFIKINHSSNTNTTVNNDNWMVAGGGKKHISISISGILSDNESKNETQIFNHIINHYCKNTNQSNLYNYKLLLPNNDQLLVKCITTACELFIIPGKFSEFKVQLDSCDIPIYTKESQI